jgi:hypothetical protein
MEDHCIRSVGRRQQIARLARQACGHAVEVALDGGNPFCEYRTIDGPHQPRRSRMAS